MEKKEEEALRGKNIIVKGSVTSPPLQEIYNNRLQEELASKVFSSATDLIILLKKEFSIKDDNARKIISRAVKQKVIKTSAPYTFGKRQYIYITSDEFLSKNIVKEVCKKTRPPIYRLLHFMDTNNGVISYYEGLKITASPIEPSSTKVQTLEDIYKLLVRLNIIYKTSDDKNIVYFLFTKDGNKLPEPEEFVLISNHFSKMVLDSSIIPDILRWLKEVNIIGTKPIYRNRKTPSIGAKHNNLMWDAFAYTNTTGIINRSTDIDKGVLVVLDVYLASEYSDICLDAFYNRIQININSSNERNRKVIPVVIYETCSDHVLNKIKKLGFLVFSISSIFGSKVISIIRKTQELDLLTHNNEAMSTQILGIFKTIEKAGQESALKDLKGTLFEFLMYPLLSSIYSSAAIERNAIIKIRENESIKQHEFDYIINSSNPREIIVVELKGYNSSAHIPVGDLNTKSSLTWFFRKAIPLAKKHFKSEIESGKRLRAILITSALFWKDGHKFIQLLNKSELKSNLLNTGYDRNSLIELLESRGYKTEIKILNKFYSSDQEHAAE